MEDLRINRLFRAQHSPSRSYGHQSADIATSLFIEPKTKPKPKPKTQFKNTITKEDIEWIQKMKTEHGIPDSAINFNQPWANEAYQQSVDEAADYNKNPGPYGNKAWPIHPRENARENLELYLDGQLMNPLNMGRDKSGKLKTGLSLSRNAPKWFQWNPTKE